MKRMKTNFNKIIEFCIENKLYMTVTPGRWIVKLTFYRPVLKGQIFEMSTYPEVDYTKEVLSRLEQECRDGVFNPCGSECFRTDIKTIKTEVKIPIEE